MGTKTQVQIQSRNKNNIEPAIECEIQPNKKMQA